MNTDNVAVEGLADTAPPFSVGKTLREARLAQGLSIADVASSIKFAPRQVEALEADDFNHLPELTFVRGFVRSYARLLHLDETLLLNELPMAHQKLSSVRVDLADVPFSTAQSARRVNLVWLSAALGVAAVLGLGVWLFEDKPAPKMEPTAQVVPMQIEPAASAVVESSGATPLPAMVQPVPKPAVTPAAPNVAAMPKPAAQPAPSVASPNAAKLTQGPIHLVFEGESWVDIKDKFGKTLLKQVNPPKSEQWVDGRPPFSLVIGNSSNVRLYYEGEEVELGEFTNVEVARLILE